MTFEPASAALGALFATLRSALDDTVVITVDVLLPPFESGVVEVTFAVLPIVPFAVPGAIWAVTENVAVAPEASEAMLQEIVAPVVQVNVGPVVCISETNVVPAGSVSVQETLVAVDGPAFETVIV